MKLRFLATAEAEFANATLWYFLEAESPQAAERFTEEVEDKYKEIQRDPYRFPIRKSGFRMWPLKNFPFSVLYYIESDEVVIATLYHHKRRPRF